MRDAGLKFPVEVLDCGNELSRINSRRPFLDPRMYTPKLQNSPPPRVSSDVNKLEQPS
jgi:hypothetical protein